MNFIRNILILILSIYFVLNANAAELIDKQYRESFSGEQIKKDYYHIQMKTVSFFDRQTSAVNGLVESFRGTSNYSYDLFTKSFITGSKGVLDAQSFTYDAAVAAIAYLLAGQPKKTAGILRVYRDEFNVSKGESIGLCNAYKTNEPRRRWGLALGADGNRTHLGPNAWVALAALQYTAITGKTDFIPYIINFLKWAQEIKHYKFKDGSIGAASMGYGWSPPDWSTVYSTENVVDHYAVLKMIKDIYFNSNIDLKPFFAKAKYSIDDVEHEMQNIEHWLIDLIYSKTKKSFNMGYNERGIDWTDALDAVSWVILAVTPERLNKLGVNPVDLMDFADQNYYVTDMIGDTEISGYDFTSQRCRGKNYRMVWFEGTCFHICALQTMAAYMEKIGNKEYADAYREMAIESAENVMIAVNKIGLIDDSLPYTSKKPGEKQIYTTFAREWEIPRGKNGMWVASSSSTGWKLMTVSAFNPFHFDKKTVAYKIFQQPVK